MLSLTYNSYIQTIPNEHIQLRKVKVAAKHAECEENSKAGSTTLNYALKGMVTSWRLI